MTLRHYRELAHKVGGAEGEQINRLVDELVEAREIIRGIRVPPLLGSKEVAEMIEVDPKNMHHVRRTKLFPKPDITVGNRPFWFETTIQTYQIQVEERRERRMNDG